MATLKKLLVELGTEIGLTGIAETLRTTAIEGPFEKNAATLEREPPAPQLTELLVQLARRGLDPQLVPALLSAFEGRPLERGLVAWDVLCGTVWPADQDDLFAELQSAASLVSSLMSGPSERCLDLNKHPSTQVIADLALAAVEDPVEEAKRNSLGAFEALRLRGGLEQKTVTSGTFGQGVAALGQLLAHAHLPSLASVTLDYALRALGHRPSLTVLWETMLDAGAGERMPGDLLKRSTESETEWVDFVEYALYRTLATVQPIKGYGILETNRKLRGTGAVATDRFVIAQTLLAPLFNDPVPPFERLDAVAQKNPSWARAWGSRFVAAAGHSPFESMLPLEAAEAYVRRFGHDWTTWYHGFRVGTQTHGAGIPWKLAACSSVGQEVLSLPHNPDAWKALVLLISDDEEVNSLLEEIDEHLVDQSDL